MRLALFLLLASMAGVGACYTSNYHDELTANVNLIADLSDKLNDYCRAGFKLDDRQVSEEEMGEFYYALKKARAYAQMIAARDSGRASYRDFGALLDEDQAFIDAANRYRLAPERDPATLDALAAEHARVRAAAARVLADLRTESR